MGVVAKRSSMVFYSNPKDHYSHRVRIVLAEKEVTVEVVDTDPNNMPEDLVGINPYNSLPALLDRDLILYEPNIMMEYLDERFPHPPLLPVYPVARANSRLLIYRIERDWSSDVDTILQNKSKDAVAKSRKELRDSLVSISPIFDEKPYFMSDEFTIVDCCVAPILWRLSELEIELPAKKCEAILKYADRLFERESFQASLSNYERELYNV
ncbi:MAG TPA: glutathione S-transferase N-terminal domain-containing protein [Pseudomonadales bacterium]